MVAALVAAVILTFSRWLAYIILFVAILIEQELYAGNSLNSVGPLVSWGSSFYSGDAIGALPLVTVATTLIVLRGAPQLLHTRIAAPATLAILLALWITLLAWFQTGSLSASLGASRHVLALLAGIMTGDLFRCFAVDHWRKFKLCLYWLVIAKSITGAVALTIGHGPKHFEGGIPIAFYDSVPLLVAASTLIVSVTDRHTNFALRQGALFASVLLAAVSLRRASLVGACLVVMILVIVSRRGPVLLRLSATVAAAALVSATFVPSAFGQLAQYLEGAVGGVLFGGTSEASTSGHLRDNAAGLRLALQHPWLGVGVDAPPTPGFVVTQGKLLYVHNEFLYAWLHFGLPGLLLLATLILLSIRLSLRIIRRAHESPPWALFGAAILLAALPGYWFFPHLLTLSRFALLVGWSLGAVFSAQTLVTARGRPSVGVRL